MGQLAEECSTLAGQEQASPTMDEPYDSREGLFLPALPGFCLRGQALIGQ